MTRGVRLSGVLTIGAGLALLAAGPVSAQSAPTATGAAFRPVEAVFAPLDAAQTRDAGTGATWRGLSDTRGGAFEAPDLEFDGGLVRWRGAETVLPAAEGRAVDRLRLSLGRRAAAGSGAFELAGGEAFDQGEASGFDVAYTRGWPMRFQGDGLDLEVEPRAGVGWTDIGGSAEAGATVRLGESVRSRLSGLGIRDGESYGERPRWYLFAAASGRAVGYNFLRDGDGFRRSGLSTDEGAFIGDAQAGMAWRRGDLQASFGYVHREIKQYDQEKTDGFVAFQLSIKPEW